MKISWNTYTKTEMKLTQIVYIPDRNTGNSDILSFFYIFETAISLPCFFQNIENVPFWPIYWEQEHARMLVCVMCWCK